MRSVRALAATAALSLLAFSTNAYAGEPKQGGILRIYHRDSPANASILEGATYSVNVPFMGVFNNLVIYDQHMAQNSPDTHQARAGRELVLEQRQQEADLQAAPGRQVA